MNGGAAPQPRSLPTGARPRLWVGGLLAGGLVLSALAGTMWGSVPLPARDVLSAVGERLSAYSAGTVDAQTRSIVLLIRLPRVLLAGLVGAALGAAGAVTQGLFRNPLADPGILGLSSGAALGAVLAIYSGLAASRLWAVPAAAFAAAFLTAFAVYLIARAGSRTPLSVLLLAGLAVTALAGAVISFLITASQQFSVAQEILFWLMGSLHDKGWMHLKLAAPPIAAGITGLCLFGRELNLLLSGEEEALAAGVEVERLKILLLGLTALAVGAAVSMSGSIGFVGLMVPHLLRLAGGGDHRFLVPASTLGGAIFLILADLVARTLLRPVELQVGVVTAFVGVPFFLYLLRTRRREVMPF